jgi:hypothetical protein
MHFARVRQDVPMGSTPSPFNQLPVPVGFHCLKPASDPFEFATQTLSILNDGFVITSPRKLRRGDILSLRLRMPPGDLDPRFWEIRRTTRVVAEHPRENGTFVYRVEYEANILPA